MATVFIALLCYQCSTMQVRQQKKSSNKWSCVVCNERQSVTKIYARSFMAKDVRSFVQTFNMSRLSADQQISTPIPDPPQTLDVQKNNKRTDWSEYIDPELDNENLIHINQDEGNAFEPKVVTELPKEMFRRPQLKNALKGSRNNDKGFKPVFQKRNHTRKITSPGEFVEMEPNESQQMMRQGLDELPDYTIIPAKESAKFQQTMKSFKRKGYESQHRYDDYQSYGMTRQQKMTVNLPLRYSGSTVEDDHSSPKGDFPEKQYAKSPFAAIALKWKGNGVQMEKVSQSLEAKTHLKNKATMVSKWNDYITEDDDDSGGYSGNLQGGSCRDDLLDHTSRWESDTYDMNLGDQKVEEDVHPDFL